MSDEDRKAFDKFSEPFIASFKPADAAEHSTAHLVAVAQRRLNRVPGRKHTPKPEPARTPPLDRKLAA